MRNYGNAEGDAIDLRIEKSERAEDRIPLVRRQGLGPLEVKEVAADIGLGQLPGVAGVKISRKRLQGVKVGAHLHGIIFLPLKLPFEESRKWFVHEKRVRFRCAAGIDSEFSQTKKQSGCQAFSADGRV